MKLALTCEGRQLIQHQLFAAAAMHSEIRDDEAWRLLHVAGSRGNAESTW